MTIIKKVWVAVTWFWLMIKTKVLLGLEKSEGMWGYAYSHAFVSVMHINAHECVCEYICGCKTHSLRVLEAKLSTDFLTSCTVSFNYPKQKDGHKQTNTVREGQKYTPQTTSTHLIQPTLATDHKWNLCAPSPVSLWPGSEVVGLIGFMPTRAHWTVVPWEPRIAFMCFVI